MRKIVRYLILCFLSCSAHFLGWAEGSKELMPNGDYGKIKLVNTIQNIPANTRFASFNGPKDFRLVVQVCDPTEKILMGFNAAFSIPIRVVAPNGTTIAYQGMLPGAGQMGYINSYAQAVAGPKTLDPAGYVPIIVNTGMAGEYSIEFDFTGTNGASYIDWFDITVIDASATPKAHPGRLWSRAWNVATESGTNPFRGSFYVYTLDQIVTKVDLSGIQPNEFIFSANNRGTSATQAPAIARQSKPGYVNYPLYQIFLNDPDSTCFPSGEIGAMDGNPTLTGCAPDYCINMNVTAPGDAIILLDLNAIPGYQPNSEDTILVQTLVKGLNCVKWDGKDGLGNVFNETAKISVNVKYVNGMTNIPMFDVENNPLGYKVTYIRPSSSSSKIVQLNWDDSKVGGTAVSSCTGACHNWPNNFGDQKTINTWWFILDSDASLFLNLKKDIDANRNTPGKGKQNDTTICASVRTVLLNGSMEGFDGSIWTILRGTGNLADAKALRTNYTLSKQDSLLDYVRLLLSSTGGTCPAIQDTITIYINPLPLVDAQATKTAICMGEDVILTGTGASTYSWDHGVTNGTAFKPASNATYQVVGTDAKGCPNSDTITVRVHALPVVTASADHDTICNGEMVTLKGSGAATYAWVPTGTDGLAFAPTASALYTVTGTDANNCQDTAKVRVVVNPCLKCVKPSAVRITSPNPVTSCAADQVIVSGEYDPSITPPLNKIYAVWYKKGQAVTMADYMDISATGLVPPKSFTSVQEPDSGVYVLRVQDGNDPLQNQCYLESEAQLIVDKAPELGTIVGPLSICEDKDTVYTVKGVKSRLPLQYSWSAGTGGASLVSSAGTNARYRFSTSGGATTGSFSVEAKNSCGLVTISSSTDILTKPKAISDIIVGPVKFCEVENSVTYTVAAQANASSYSWYWNDVLQSSKANSVVINRSQWSGGTLPKVKVLPENVCGEGPEKTLQVRVFEMPYVTFAQNPQVVSYKYEGQTSAIIVTGTGLEVDTLSSVKWSPSTWLSDSDTLQPLFLAHKEEMTYQYALTVSTDSSTGCVNSFPYTIINTLDVWVPNAFSPNGDGKNDTWVIDGMLKYPNSQVNVFNRWGNKIYSSNNGYKVPWDGSHYGTELPSATYYYVIDLKGSPDNTDHSVTGSLTIVH